MSGPTHYKNKFVRWINRNNIKVGDKVQIHALYPTSDTCILNRFNEALLNYWGRNNDWLKNVIKFSKMYNKQIATIVEINYDNSRSNIILDIVDGVPWPFYCLQKVKDTDITNTTIVEKVEKEETMISVKTFTYNEKVIIRANKDNVWILGIYDHYDCNKNKYLVNTTISGFIALVAVDAEFIHPYEGNEYLLNTKKSYYQFNKGDLVLITEGFSKSYLWAIGSFKDITSVGTYNVFTCEVNKPVSYTYCIPYKGNEDKLNKHPKEEDIY